MRNKLELMREEIRRQLAYSLRPGGEIDRKARREIEELLDSEVSLQGARVRVRMTLHSWLTLVTQAHEVGWRPGDAVGLLDSLVPAEDAKQLAVALAKVDRGPNWRRVIMGVQLVGLSGEFKVHSEAGQMAPDAPAALAVLGAEAEGNNLSV